MKEVLASPQHELFFDPFAEEGAEEFNPIVAHEAMWERYAAHEIEHDYTVDHFVADTQALMLDAQFTERFDEAAAIAQRMHMLCGEDHGLAQRVSANETLQELLGDEHHHEVSDVHGHDHKQHNKQSRLKLEEETEESKKKKKWFTGFFASLFRGRRK